MGWVPNRVREVFPAVYGLGSPKSSRRVTLASMRGGYRRIAGNAGMCGLCGIYDENGKNVGDMTLVIAWAHLLLYSIHAYYTTV